jgi:hypothetical protein
MQDLAEKGNPYVYSFIRTGHETDLSVVHTTIHYGMLKLTVTQWPLSRPSGLKCRLLRTVSLAILDSRLQAKVLHTLSSLFVANFGRRKIAVKCAVHPTDSDSNRS